LHKIHELETQVESLNGEISTLQSDKDHLLSSSNTVNLFFSLNSPRKVDTEIQNLREENQKSKQQIADLTKEYEAKIETLNQEISDLQNEKDNLLTSNTSEIERLREEVENNKQQIADFEGQIESLTAQISTLEGERENLLTSSTSVFVKFCVLMLNHIFQADKETQALRQEIENNKQQITDFETQIESLNSQISTLESEKESLLSSKTSVFILKNSLTYIYCLQRLIMKFKA